MSNFYKIPITLYLKTLSQFSYTIFRFSSFPTYKCTHTRFVNLDLMNFYVYLVVMHSCFHVHVRTYVLQSTYDVIGARVVRHYGPLPTEVAVMARS